MKGSKKRLTNTELSQFIVYVCILFADILLIPAVCFSNASTHLKAVYFVIGVVLVILLVVKIVCFIKYIISK